jgi:hypothetical protein
MCGLVEKAVRDSSVDRVDAANNKQQTVRTRRVCWDATSVERPRWMVMCLRHDTHGTTALFKRAMPIEVNPKA